MGFFTAKLGIPAPIAFLVILAESFGAVGLILGLGTRITAFGIGCIMVIGGAMMNLQHGFFINWFGKQAGEGIEFHLANSIWYREDLRFEDAFLEVNQRYFDALVSPLNFLDPSASRTINEWVDDQTNGRIDRIVPADGGAVAAE